MTVKQTKELIEQINSNKGIYEKYHLISVWWGNYWLYLGDFAKAIGKWIAKGKIAHIYNTAKEGITDTIKEDFRFF